MKPRLNAVELAPAAYRGWRAVEKAIMDGPVPEATAHLVKLRVSQINGCAYCVDMHSHDAKGHGESDERLFAVAAWREAPYFTDAERAALALAEEATRLADRGDAVPDAVWEEAARHYDEETLAALVVVIAQINAWNRLQVTTRAVAGSHRR